MTREEFQKVVAATMYYVRCHHNASSTPNAAIMESVEKELLNNDIKFEKV